VADFDREAGGAGHVEAEHAVAVVAAEPVGDGEVRGPGPVKGGANVVEVVGLDQ
jgi:hypothetical protein